jgi:hypothetical protein
MTVFGYEEFHCVLFTILPLHLIGKRDYSRGDVHVFRRQVFQNNLLHRCDTTAARHVRDRDARECVTPTPEFRMDMPVLLMTRRPGL